MKKFQCYQETAKKKGLTRRDVLRTGLGAMGSYVMIPSFLAQVIGMREAKASGASLPWKHLHIHMDGGACIQKFLGAGALMNTPTTTLLANGWTAATPSTANSVVTIGGYPFFNIGSGDPSITGASNPAVTGTSTVTTPGNTNTFLAGVQAWASPSDLARVSIVYGCLQLNDDGGETGDEVTPEPFLAGIGMAGSVSAFASNQNTPNGTSAGTFPTTSTATALFANSVNAFQAAVSLSGPMTANYTTAQNKAFVTALSALSATQLTPIAKNTNGNGQNAAEAASQTYTQTIQNTTNPMSVSGLTDPIASAACNVSSTTAQNSAAAVYATGLAWLGQGMVGGLTNVLGGGDYHGQVRTAVANYDFNAGMRLGQAIRWAVQAKTQLAIHVGTNGSVVGDSSNAAGTNEFLGDSGNRSGWALVLVDGVNPTPPKVSSNVLGRMLSTGLVDNTSSVALTSPSMGIGVLMANILALNGVDPGPALPGDLDGAANCPVHSSVLVFIGGRKIECEAIS